MYILIFKTFLSYITNFHLANVLEIKTKFLRIIIFCFFDSFWILKTTVDASVHVKASLSDLEFSQAVTLNMVDDQLKVSICLANFLQ